MWTRTHSKVYSGISKESVWALWTDIDNWSQWHDDLAYCKLEQPFGKGAQFILKPKRGPKVKITITEVDEGREFTDVTPFFGAKMHDTHIVEETDEGVRLTNKLVVSGPLKWLWVKLVANSVAETVIDEFDAVAELARQRA